uniref:Uncharacterized protein n=1 Tax=Oryzias latipes TaxID=8090 RepID=A0A3P9HZM6_ORYLA
LLIALDHHFFTMSTLILLRPAAVTDCKDHIVTATRVEHTKRFNTSKRQKSGQKSPKAQNDMPNVETKPSSLHSVQEHSTTLGRRILKVKKEKVDTPTPVLKCPQEISAIWCKVLSGWLKKTAKCKNIPFATFLVLSH